MPGSRRLTLRLIRVVHAASHRPCIAAKNRIHHGFLGLSCTIFCTVGRMTVGRASGQAGGGCCSTSHSEYPKHDACKQPLAPHHLDHAPARASSPPSSPPRCIGTTNSNLGSTACRNGEQPNLLSMSIVVVRTISTTPCTPNPAHRECYGSLRIKSTLH